MKEPVLFNDKTQNETYRFLWLRTFNEPAVIKITKQQNTYTIYWRLFSGQGGYQLGKLGPLNQKKISKQNWDDFLSKLQQINFWHLKKDSTYKIGFDGAQWLFEGKTAMRYQAVDKWSPEGEFYNCGNFLIKLTGLKIKKEDIY
ncbi:MAG: hypothetical protein JWQ57_2612 [Mucilaginibacter sp.]|nr:hypothetical protein [Mucilaginibacter sp.]